MIRVLVVEDSITVRKRLCEVLAGDPEMLVVGEASNGQQAISACSALRPDVITMDMMMPEVSGLAATEHIMAHFPTPILVVSSSTNRGELFQTFDALSAGAVDVLEKPSGDEPDGAWEQRFLSTVKLVSRIRVITHLRGRLAARHPLSGGAWHGSQMGAQLGSQLGPATLPGALAGSRTGCQLIAIGASTGGPGAVVDVLRALPPKLRVPVLLVQHINEPFGSAFAEWLDTQTPRRTRYARHGEPLAAVAGMVAMAPPGQHLLLEHGRLQLSMAPPRHSCRPSVDVLFESIARDCGASTAACLLTGMGRDGAAGLLALRRAGGRTIAQDEASSVVYGMPREAAQLGAALQILPLGEIGPALAAMVQE